MSTIETIQGVYAAFGRGDVPAILEVIADDCAWEYGWESIEMPWLKPRRGKQGVAEFFATLMAELEFLRFAVNHIVGNEQVVVAVFDNDAVVRATGKTIRERDETHVWHFDANGKVIRFRHCPDTLQHYRAFKG